MVPVPGRSSRVASRAVCSCRAACRAGRCVVPRALSRRGQARRLSGLAFLVVSRPRPCVAPSGLSCREACAAGWRAGRLAFRAVCRAECHPGEVSRSGSCRAPGRVSSRAACPAGSMPGGVRAGRVSLREVSPQAVSRAGRPDVPGGVSSGRDVCLAREFFRSGRTACRCPGRLAFQAMCRAECRAGRCVVPGGVAPGGASCREVSRREVRRAGRCVVPGGVAPGGVAARVVCHVWRPVAAGMSCRVVCRSEGVGLWDCERD
ncbi:hypothetical protein EV643_107240 [Kribbella sp. VKM Ac-2527]|uniref:Uncharacterized protein n=1 Tax=Kribbella caucasensis TaxID=2512215 RepID=A0A4R6KFK7_9ACTN|nr:hypothetical protein EV643_107240 [Kribbella sp. VKM Ac-2527]